MQLVSAAAFSLMHGANDAQKTMGIIAGALVTGGFLDRGPDGALPIPYWVILLANGAIALGTLSGGWRIIKTMGTKITKLQPIGGFGTTHTITGAIVGVGSSKRVSAVRWGVAQQIMWAWVLTIPASAFIGGLTYEIFRVLFQAP